LRFTTEQLINPTTNLEISGLVRKDGGLATSYPRVIDPQIHGNVFPEIHAVYYDNLTYKNARVQ